MFGTPPPDRSKPKIDAYINNLSARIASLESLRKELSHAQLPADQRKKFDTALRDQVINLSNTRTLLNEAKDPGFFAWIRRGEKIMEVQDNPESSNTRESIHRAETVADQVKTAMFQYKQTPVKPSTVIIERARVNPEGIVNDLIKKVDDFYAAKLDGKIPQDQYGESSLNQYDMKARVKLRAEIRDVVAQIDDCITKMQKVMPQEKKEELLQLKAELNEAHKFIANLPDKPAVEAQEVRRPGLGK